MADTASTVGALLYDSNNRPYYVRNNHRYYVTQPEEQYYRAHHHGVVRKAYVPEQEIQSHAIPTMGTMATKVIRTITTDAVPVCSRSGVGNTSHCRITRTIQSPARLIQHALGIRLALRRRVDSVSVCAGNKPRLRGEPHRALAYAQ